MYIKPIYEQLCKAEAKRELLNGYDICISERHPDDILSEPYVIKSNRYSSFDDLVNCYEKLYCINGNRIKYYKIVMTSIPVSAMA